MRTLIAALALAAALGAAPAFAQSLTPMEKLGETPTDTKGFKVVIGNPYPTRMTFVVTPMDPTFSTEVGGAVVKPGKITIAPGHQRTVILAFKIDPAQKERTIGLCVVPYKFEGPILPRVCGRYTGRLR
jgi:hypothetical protein